VTFSAATRCWGLALALGTALPAADQSAPPTSPKAPATPAYDHAWSAPIESPGQIHVASDGTLVFALDGKHGLRAFTVDDGRIVWTMKGVTAEARLAGGGGLLFVATPPRPEADSQVQTPGRLDAVAQIDGRLVWTARVDVTAAVDPVVLSGSVILAADRELREYSSRDGSVAWQQTFDAPPVALADDDGRLFVALANNTLLSLDEKTHARMFETALESAAVALVAAEGRVFVSDTEGSLVAYRQDRAGSFLWRVRRAEVIGRPAVDERHVYVAQFDNTARAYDVGNGTERWRLRLDTRPLPGVQIAVGWVFFPLLSGSVASATAVTRTGQPSGEIPLAAPEASGDQRLHASRMTRDGRVIARISRPSSHPAWTLTVAKRKDG